MGCLPSYKAFKLAEIDGVWFCSFLHGEFVRWKVLICFKFVNIKFIGLVHGGITGGQPKLLRLGGIPGRRIQSANYISTEVSDLCRAPQQRKHRMTPSRSCSKLCNGLRIRGPGPAEAFTPLEEFKVRTYRKCTENVAINNGEKLTSKTQEMMESGVWYGYIVDQHHEWKGCSFMCCGAKCAVLNRHKHAPRSMSVFVQSRYLLDTEVGRGNHMRRVVTPPVFLSNSGFHRTCITKL